MRIDEFTQSIDRKMPFNPVDDCAIYMRNDPMFYRKSLFPVIMSMKDMYNKKQTLNASKCLGECALKAMESYCKKYNLGKIENVFTDNDKDALIQKIFSEEMKMIKDGAY